MTARRVEVAIVGAGFAGLGMAIALQRRGPTCSPNTHTASTVTISGATKKMA